MYHKIKNTLAGMFVAISMVGISYSVGHPPIQSTVQVDYKQPGVEAQLGELQAARQRLRGMRSQFSMPFYSFAPLLPRREG